MNRAQIIANKLQILAPSNLKVIDESDQHRGHVGNHYDGESHYKIIITADKLKGQSLISQHRIINNILADELSKGLHALSISVIN